MRVQTDAGDVGARPARRADLERGLGSGSRVRIGCATCSRDCVMRASASACFSMPIRSDRPRARIRRRSDRAIHRPLCAALRNAGWRTDRSRASRRGALARKIGLGVNAGHDLDLKNIPGVRESGEGSAGSIDRPRAVRRRDLRGSDAHGEGVPEGAGLAPRSPCARRRLK